MTFNLMNKEVRKTSLSRWTGFALKSIALAAVTSCSNHGTDIVTLRSQADAANPALQIPAAADGLGIVGGAKITPGTSNSSPVLDAIGTSTVVIISGGFDNPISLCSGSLVNGQWLVTAAHCLFYPNRTPLQRIAVFDLYFGNVPWPLAGFQPSAALVRRVTASIVHADYAATPASADIAMLQFSGGMPTGFKPATFHQESPTDNLLSQLFVAGYGTISALTKAAGTLFYAQVFGLQILVDHPSAGANTYVIFHTGDQNTCSGDSGGPAYFVSTTGQALNAAINSTTSIDCTDGFINVNISRYLPWMRSYAGTVQSSPFTVPQFTLSAAKAGSGSGIITSSPSGINCGVACSYSFSSGTTITLTASPASGSTFGGWQQGCTSVSGNKCTIASLAAARAVTAVFNVSSVAAKPTSLSAVGTSRSQIRLSWSHTGVNVQGFRIEQSRSATGPFNLLTTVGSTARSYDHSLLLSNSTYYYRVAAYGSGGMSPFGTILNATSSSQTVAQGSTGSIPYGLSWTNAVCLYDVNGDRTVDRRDYYVVLNDFRSLSSLQLPASEIPQFRNADDVNRDNVLDVRDVFAVMNDIRGNGERACP